MAVRHSAGLARDIKVAFKDVLVSQPKVSPRTVYCAPKSLRGVGSGGGGTGHGNNATGTAGTEPTGTASQPPATSGFKTVTHRPGVSSTSDASPSATSTDSAQPTPAAGSSSYSVIESHQGSSFFDGWDFFTGGDPTNGIVSFIDQGTASQNGLANVNAAGNAVMRVETTPQVQNTRQAVRITTTKSYNGGLVIMDSVHMPTGCGTWPAFWSNGPNWPSGGEIDIVEGVNDYSNNQATIHTDPGCSIASSDSSKLAITGKVVGGTNCAALQTGNQGCGVRASQANSFGAAFNNGNGGVYAMRWDDQGISVFFFARGSVPADIDAGAPQPDSWGQPMATWPASACDPNKFFHDHSLIFDTTLCGDWASGVWGASGVPGQDQSCAQTTGFSTCEAYVRAKGDALDQAFWEVKSVKIYQKN